MAKLYFRYGAVGSAKTLNVLAVAHNYRQQNKEVLLIKPQVDKRFGVNLVKSRAGLSQPADIVLSSSSSNDNDTNADSDSATLIDEDSNLLNPKTLQGISCVLVDEAQFLTVKQVEKLRELTIQFNIPVICYGLRTDFTAHLFPASKRLIELADSLEEVKTTCYFCNRKAILNLKHADGKAVMDGPIIEMGCEERYFPTCYSCYKEAILRSKAGSIEPESMNKVLLFD